MSDIFISYTRSDATQAHAIADALRGKGYTVFFDASIAPGDSWDRRIERELNSARLVVVLWSAASCDRQWVRNEARVGLSRGILCPARIDNCEIPVEFSHVQTVDLTHLEPGQGWSDLLAAIETRVGAGSEVNSPITAAGSHDLQHAGASTQIERESPQSWLWIVLLAVIAAGSATGHLFVQNSLLYAPILGVIQGLTEFLPISSTAHLLISERLIGFSDPGSVFTVMIQLGSILAVMWLYRHRIIDVITGLPTKPEARRFALMLLVAFLPAIPIGFFGKHFVTTVLHESFEIMAWAFIIGGILMLLIERFRPTPKVEDAADTPVWRAFIVGIFQCFALIPGVSRSGATIYGGLLTGLDRRAAAEFSFFLAMPTMTAAFVLDFLDVKDSITSDRIAEIAVGFVFAFLSALIVVKPFLAFVTRAGFMPFAAYRILAGAAVLAALSAGYLH